MKFVSFLQKIWVCLSPPPAWKVPVIILFGSIAGLGMVVTYIARAHSYLSDNPEVCMNCHIMAPQYATWQRSSHASVATCNDCHVPQDNFVRKYMFKGYDGTRHSTMFTLRMEPQVIQIKNPGKAVVQENCIRCHFDFLFDVSAGQVTLKDSHQGQGKLCFDCHRETPHGRVNSLASVPYARVPELSPITPEWIVNKP